MKKKFIYWCIFIALVFICLPATALAANNPVGVAYRGHIQDLGDYPADGSWVDSPAIIGTEGQSKRIEGFEIKLTGTIPAGMELRYNVHVQNKGWLYDEDDSTDWPKDGAYAGTRGESLRIEAVKIVLTDSEGKPVPGYSVQYRGHVQNVGDLPADATEWYTDGAQLGTVGSSLRLEALLVQVVKTTVEPVVYDKAGIYGSASDSQTIAGDVTVAADGVTLQNLVIDGNLTIGEAVGNGTVTLNNVTVKGDTLVRGGGVNSIHINGGSYKTIIMEKTASGAIRIVAVGVDGLAVVISEDAAGETIILEGAFDSVTVNAPNMTVTTQGNTTTIGKLTVGATATGATLNLANGTMVTDLVLDGTAAVKGQGTVTRAEVNADSVVFEMIPGSYAVESDVVIPPVFPTPNNGGGGGGTPTVPGVVASVTLDKTTLALGMTKTAQLTATVLPTTATDKTLTWTSSDDSIATVDTTGKVTGIKEGGPVTITATAINGKKASCAVTVVPGYDVAIDGNNKATITKFYGTSTALTIPGTIDGAEVVAIGTEVFKGLGLTSVDIPASVTSIDLSAFEGCVQLTTVSFGAGSGLLSIGQNAFTGCEKLDTITLPNQLKMIDDRAFQNCTSLKSLVLPASLTMLGESAFSTTGLTAITIPNLVTSIKQFAFENCPALAVVTLPANLQTLGSATFLNCDSLADITIPASVIEIGGNTFQSCDNLTTVTFAAGSQLTAIPVGMFELCTKLTAVNFNNAPQITTIGDRAFLGCSRLVNINLPNAVTVIDSLAFKACSELTAIAIPDKVTTIKGSAFENCTELNTVSFGPGSQLTSIGNIAFRGCPKLINITIPKLVSTIESGAFGFDAGTKTTACTYTFRGAAPATFTANAIPTTPNPKIKYYENYDSFKAGIWVGYTDKQPILTKPTGLSATPSYGSQPVVTLSWTAVADVTAYDIFISETDGSFTGPPITVPDGTLSTIISSGLTSGKTYYFAVKARDDYGESLLSDSMSAVVPYQYPVDSITVSATPATLVVGNSGLLSAAFLPVNASNKTVSWSSADTNIATVDAATGVITAKLTTGTVTMTGTTADGGKTGTCQVTVVADQVTGVTLDQSSLSVGVTKTAQLSATVAPAGVTTQTVSWLSSNNAIATVDGTGKITGIKEGPVTITATTAQGGFTKICSVTVTEGYDVSVTDNKATITKYYGENKPVVIPDTIDVNGTPVAVGAIGESAFNGLGITEVTIPATVTSIGFKAFEYCSQLTTVNFVSGSQLTTIEPAAFSSCQKLQTIALPATVTAIKGSAFAWCYALKTINLPGGLETLEQGAFSYCQQLESITIPAQIATIPNGAFNGCFNLTSVTLPANLTSIEANAFKDCSKLVAITIPDKVATIGTTAFSFSSETPPAARTFTFMGNAPTLEANAIKETDEGTVITIRRTIGSTGFYIAPWTDYQLVVA